MGEHEVMPFLALVAMLLSQAVAVDAQESKPSQPSVNVIFDTDMHTDCDDAGALAMLHALADEGRVRILATLHTAPAPFGPRCLDSINTYYGRGAIPIGGMTWPNYATDPRYTHYRIAARHIEDAGSDYVETVAREFPGMQSEAAIPDSVSQYRRVLAAAADGSVVICAVGQLAGLAGLLDSRGDDISPLDGVDLVRRKVRVLVSMAGAMWPEGKDGFNWDCDIPSAAHVLNHWPVPLAVMPHGSDILTGQRLVREGSPDNPVRRAYEIYVKRPDHLRSSWDQCAVLYAVNGPEDLFEERKGYRLHFDGATGRHTWDPDPASPHIYLDQKATSETIAARIEELMCRVPRRSQGPSQEGTSVSSSEVE